MRPNEGNTILLYQASDGKTRVEVQLDHETVWLSLNQMSELFQREKCLRKSKRGYAIGRVLPSKRL